LADPDELKAIEVIIVEKCFIIKNFKNYFKY
jgi:hypothetical protein